MTPLVVVFALVNPQIAARGETRPAPVSQQTGISVPPNGPVKVYGQVLDPQRVQLKGSKYTWKGLKYLMPDILPKDVQQKNLEPQDVCRIFHDLNGRYLKEAEDGTALLSFLLGFAFTDEYSHSEVVLSEKLGSPSQKDLDDLKSMLLKIQTQITKEKTLEKAPHWNKDLQDHVESLNIQDEIADARKMTLKSLAMIMLYDAALAQCPAYAKQKGYYIVP